MVPGNFPKGLIVNTMETQSRRRRYRARRLRLQPERPHVPHRERMLEGALADAMSALMRAQEAQREHHASVETIKRQLLQSREEMEELRRRGRREREESGKANMKRFVEALLPVLDAFDQALASAGNQNDGDPLYDGMQAIRALMDKSLEQLGVEKISPEGEPFDPEQHEALSMEATDAQPPNTVVGVIQAGYRYGERLLRPARVRVSQAAAPANRN